MKVLWCWRCRQDMPMLDEDEFASVAALYRDAFKLSSVPLRDRYLRVRQEYERLTGFVDCHENVVMHHRVATFGPPCGACGKPLRTPRARHCAACSAPRSV